ncbi:hypothetical protein [Nocardioides daejeonensis]|uniref:hypothetical protein n=1 Tax=Nocardioides daejeonensis TaxID=1046556 RepID=UPI000D747ED0|nr:hypothetical protein [Nocardioides daejeonensis]
MDIFMNGKRLNSADEIPEELRERLRGVLPDDDGDGIPDILQGRMNLADFNGATVMQSVEINGKTVSSFDDVPPQFRQMLEQFIGTPPAAAQQPAATAHQPAATTPAEPTVTDQVMLNGQLVDSQSALGGVPERKWWQFWK